MTEQKITVLNVSDPLVRRLAERNHEPREIWADDGSLISLACWMCNQSWPCETRKAVDALKEC